MPFKYWRYGLEDLQDFVKSRTSEDAPVGARGRDLIRMLEELDLQSRFQGFLQLPAELRIPIYELLLRRDRATQSKATLGLLRACKQVYKEARGILRSESTVYLQLGFHRSVDSATWDLNHWRYRADPSFLPRLRGLKTPLHHSYIDHLNAGLTRFNWVRHLVIDLDIHDGDRAQPPWAAPRHFFTEIVRICSELKSLKVDFGKAYIRNLHTQELPLEFLQPLTRLRSGVALTLKGTPEGTAFRLRRSEERDFWMHMAEVNNGRTLERRESCEKIAEAKEYKGTRERKEYWRNY